MNEIRRIIDAAINVRFGREINHGIKPMLRHELVHLIGALNETTIYVDKAAGNGEGIHFLRVDDEKVPVEIATAREPRDRIS